ncbi:MAG: NCS2 family permease [Erysipelotrichaceae bacterium]|nr:NCS2 family permease [Erysipelotrichaceae bacterium]
MGRTKKVVEPVVEEPVVSEEEKAPKEEAIVEEPKAKNVSKFDKFFGITASGSSIRIEIIAGIATFLAMAYILTVNPNQILYGGTSDPRWSSIFIATAFGAIIGTLLMALLAKLPLAQAPGLGLNSAVGALVGGASGAFAGASLPLGSALLLVLISGLVFLLLSVIPGGKEKGTGRLIALREKIFEGMPAAIRIAVPVGIGLFIAFIGFQNASVIVNNDYTLVSLVNLGDWELYKDGGPACQALVCIFGLIVIAILSHCKVKGAVIFGILAATVLGLPLGVTNIDVLLGKTDGVTWKFWENFSNYFSMDPENGGVFFAIFTEGFSGFNSSMIMPSIVTVISFCMIDMFDTMGTCVGCCSNAGLLDENGKPVNYSKIMYSDSIATCVGAALGTSTVTTFVESGVGVAAGGKTGLTALVTAVLFLLAIFILPVFAFVPSAAAACALVYVGVLMMKSVVDIDFKSIKNAVPAFLTIIMMPLSYSITTGIGVGIITYVIISVIVYICDLIKFKACKDETVEKPVFDVSIVMFVVFALFLVYFLTQ